MSKTLEAVSHLEDDARGYGFYYPNTELIIKQIKDECDEVLEAIHQNESPERIQEEIGDLIHATMALCHHQGFDIDETILKAANKFSKRMVRLKEAARNEGLDNLHGQPLSDLIRLWKQAK
jgi:uncharacterized protein YabN with tetrapyrrole methylase and pyrophosphatase domain